MEFTCRLMSFRESWQLAARVVPANPPSPPLACVLLSAADGKLSFRATNFALVLRHSLSGVAVARPGVALVPKETVSEIVDRADGDEVVASCDDRSLSIRCGRAAWTIQAGDPALFPDVAWFDCPAYHTLPAESFRRAIRRTAYAVDPDSTRYALGGVCVERSPASLTFVATDARRLSSQAEDATFVGAWADDPAPRVIPEAACKALAQMVAAADAIDLAFPDDRRVMARFGGTEVMARLVEGRFPRWRDLIRDRSAIVIPCDAAALAAVVGQAATFRGDDGTRQITLSLSAGSLRLSAVAADAGRSEAEMPVAWEGDTFSCDLRADYLLEALRPLSGEVTIGLEPPNGAIDVRTSDGFLGAIMPLNAGEAR